MSNVTTTTTAAPVHAAETAWKIIPCFTCRSPSATAVFYSTYLHFKTVTQPPGDSPTLCSAFVGDKAAANIYLFKHEGPEDQFKTGKCAIAMHDRLDEFYEELKGGGKVEISEEIEDKPWGYRQFNVKDADENEIVWFKFLEGGEEEKD